MDFHPYTACHVMSAFLHRLDSERLQWQQITLEPTQRLSNVTWFKLFMSDISNITTHIGGSRISNICITITLSNLSCKNTKLANKQMFGCISLFHHFKINTFVFCSCLLDRASSFKTPLGALVTISSILINSDLLIWKKRIRRYIDKNNG